MIARLIDAIVERKRRIFWGVLLVLLAAHVAAIYREAVNWDEFVLFSHAAETLGSGVLRSGGRGGLGTLVLLPFVRGCEDPLAAAHAARWLWTGFTVALVAGFWLLLHGALDGPEERRWNAASLGTALLVCVPAFLATSLQVRTDQPAVAFGLWAGVLLLRSRERTAWALLGGALLAVGFLFSQKLVYVAALIGTLAVAATLLEDRFRPRRDLTRVALTVVAGWGVLALWNRLIPLFFAPPDVTTVGRGLSTFEIYREVFGYDYYAMMAPTLLPHIALLLLMLRRSPGWLRERRWRVRLLLVGAVLALGVAVGLFHAGAFPYFWMTVGLFPAAALAAGLAPLEEWLEARGRRRAVLVAAWGFLAVQGLTASGIFLQDTQAEQRASFAFVDRNFPAGAQGFSTHRAFFCQHRSRVRAVGFVQTMRAVFPEGDSKAVERFVGEMREAPIAFLLDDGWLDQYPSRVRRFWREHYRPYYASVAIPGWEIRANEASVRTLHVFVEGDYRWVPAGSGGDAGSLVVDGRRLRAGERVRLSRGPHRVALTGSTAAGELLYAVEDDRRLTGRPFYRSFNSMAFPYLGEPLGADPLLR